MITTDFKIKRGNEIPKEEHIRGGIKEDDYIMEFSVIFFDEDIHYLPIKFTKEEFESLDKKGYNEFIQRGIKLLGEIIENKIEKRYGKKE